MDGEIVGEKEIADLLLKIKEPMVEDSVFQTPKFMQERAKAAVAMIHNVAIKSSNVKGSDG